MCRYVRTIGAHISEQSMRYKTKECRVGSVFKHYVRSEEVNTVEGILTNIF